MNKLLIFIAAQGLLTFTISSPPAVADEDPLPLGPPLEENLITTPNSKTKLIGAIEHSALLPPVPAHLRAGTEVNIAKLKKLEPDNQWFKIPLWYAGSWETRRHTIYYQKALDTGAESFPLNSHFALGAETSGFQRDRAGAIWEFAYGEYISILDLADGYELQLVHFREPLEIADNKLMMLFRAHTIFVSSSDNKIQHTKQVESIQTYTPAGNGLIRVDASVKTFNEAGKPVRLTKILAFKRQTQPFQPRDRRQGRNMRKLFDEYLESHGMNELRPAPATK